MKFKLDTHIPEFGSGIRHGNKLVFLGSCFSDEMAVRFQQAGFELMCNPFGTIFHPLPLARILENALDEQDDFRLFEAKNSFFSWNASTLFSKPSKKALEADFRSIQTNLRESLEKATHVFVTFGSAWGYTLEGTDYVVANCHKQAASQFEKQLTEIERMTSAWERIIERLKEFNPALTIVFTVSPVRHSKDGLVENNRSKARLLEVISRLETKQQTGYFPSYEIVIDELRDYRFYKEDLIHPNKQAITYIWGKMQQAFCSSETRDLIREVEKLRQLENHRPLSNDENEKAAFEKNREEKISLFKAQHPEVYWSEND